MKELPASSLSPSQKTAWMPSLQALRGLAALWVVVYHVEVQLVFLGGAMLGVPGWRFGWLGVDLFFVLSGFLLAPAFFRDAPPPPSRFYLDRFLRIGPAYHTVFALSLAYVAWGGTQRYLADHVDPANALLNAVFLQNWHLPAFWAVNPVFWTLAVEMQFYLVLPLLARAFGRRTWPYALAVCVAGSLLFRALTWHPPEAGEELFALGPLALTGAEWTYLGTFALPAFLGHFALGISAARLRASPYPARMLIVGSALAIAPTLLWIPEGIAFGFETLAGQVLVRPIAAVGFALVILALISPGRLHDMFATWPLRRLGQTSYSLYLIHVPVLYLLVDAFAAAGTAATTRPWAFAALGVLGSIAAAEGLHRLVEGPAERWRRARKAI